MRNHVGMRGWRVKVKVKVKVEVEVKSKRGKTRCELHENPDSKQPAL